MKELRFHGETIITGVNSVEYLKELNHKRVFIATGEGSSLKNGAISRITRILEEQKTDYIVYSGIGKNPTAIVVEEGLKKMLEFQPDVIIAVGGGSPIDAAKVMALLYDYQELSIDSLMTVTLPEKRTFIKFIAIPTTSGTGTEVTKSAVITFVKENIKIGLKSKAFIPDIAILDASFALTMPQNVVAETGMDAMTHAVECFINKNIDDFTECLAAGAIEGLFKHLYISYSKGDYESRERVHNFQCIAGCAFANVGLGLAHGISHSIGGMFNLGHGLINAVVLPYILKFNAQDEEVKDRLDYLAKRIEKNDFIAAIIELNSSMGIPSSFKEMGILKSDFEEKFEELVDNSLKGSTRVNPVMITRDQMKKLLQDIYNG